MRHLLAEHLLRGDLHDPRLVGRSLTVAEVRVSRDLKTATGVHDRAWRRAEPRRRWRRCSTRPHIWRLAHPTDASQVRAEAALRSRRDFRLRGADRRAAARARSGRGRPTRTRPMARRKRHRPADQRLAGDRQAARHDLDPCRGRGQAADPGAEGRPRRHARSRWPPACCRSRWARRPRPSPTSWTPARPTISRYASARRATPTTLPARSPPPAAAAERRRDPAALPQFIGLIHAGAAAIRGGEGAGRARLRHCPSRRDGRARAA